MNEFKQTPKNQSTGVSQGFMVAIYYIIFFFLVLKQLKVFSLIFAQNRMALMV
jgi:hypothetical protein